MEPWLYRVDQVKKITFFATYECCFES